MENLLNKLKKNKWPKTVSSETIVDYCGWMEEKVSKWNSNHSGVFYSLEWQQDSFTLLRIWISNLADFPKSTTSPNYEYDPDDFAILIEISSIGKIFTIRDCDLTSSEAPIVCTDKHEQERDKMTSVIADLESEGYSFVPIELLQTAYPLSDDIHFRNKPVYERLFGHA